MHAQAFKQCFRKGRFLAAALLAAGSLLPPAPGLASDDFLTALAARPNPGGVSSAAAPLPSTLRQTLEGTRQAPRSPAEVWAARQWLNDMMPRLARRVPDAERRRALLSRVHQEARLAGLAPELVLAVIQVESAFQAEAVSSAGAVGLMQIMPFWIRELGLPADDLKDPERNLRYGCTILAHYLAVEDGDLTRALARYNGSLGKTWYPERVMRALSRHWSSAGGVVERLTAER
ncbi:soluble lytic murein transglycosylase-related regulatory protein [Halomonas beimenensis]|uniref:Soluble lytic murein transglycosylase-related regulatory protein n=1 Tax=Halomonas beimenensis TaxID=475662 RepID=A0A291P5Z7_9GAMM|nr:soluble lytic murein transglycosylase-related regulatory protein [Halomonas beimenensis]